MSVISITHPTYDASADNWRKWRLTFEGGNAFVSKYLKTFSAREDATDFATRKEMTYCPAFAKAALLDIKNAIFQRVTDIVRLGGPASYQAAIAGQNQGVDLNGSTMNSFIGRQILPELLALGKVGIFVDRQRTIEDQTQASKKPSPYIYTYAVEDIMSWTYQDNDRPWEFKAVLLRDHVDEIDPETQLPTGIAEQYRFLFIGDDDKVHVQLYNSKGVEGETFDLQITRIPFVVAELSDSLMRDIAEYQIALLNLESSDLAYLLKANFPFYTEQTDLRATGTHLKAKGSTNHDADDDTDTDDAVTVGTMHGRKYGKGTDRPDFIAPPVAPLLAAMQKEAQIKDDIRQLVALALQNLKSASAESKGMDARGLEAGLSYIGLELEHAEKQVAQIWGLYEGDTKTAEVKYPKRYSLKSDADILDEAKALEERMMAVPSETYKREVAKVVAHTMLGAKVSLETMDKIDKEIDEAKILTTDPKIIEMAVQNGLLGNVGAAKSLGIPKEEVKVAKVDHAERAARILKAQTAAADARGVGDLANQTDGSKAEKDSEGKIDSTDKTRGEGK